VAGWPVSTSADMPSGELYREYVACLHQRTGATTGATADYLTPPVRVTLPLGRPQVQQRGPDALAASTASASRDLSWLSSDRKDNGESLVAVLTSESTPDPWVGVAYS
jgi:hypothetical protein